MIIIISIYRKSIYTSSDHFLLLSRVVIYLYRRVGVVISSNQSMEQFDFTKPTPFYDIVLNVEDKKLYCNRAFLAIWSPVFDTMFKSNFRERDSMEINLPGKSFDDIKELLAIIYPPNRPIVATNVQRLLELADVTIIEMRGL